MPPVCSVSWEIKDRVCGGGGDTRQPHQAGDEQENKGGGWGKVWFW